MKIRQGFVSNSSSSSFICSYPKTTTFEIQMYERFRKDILKMKLEDDHNELASEFLHNIEDKKYFTKKDIKAIENNDIYYFDEEKKKIIKELKKGNHVVYFRCPCDGDSPNTLTNLIGKQHQLRVKKDEFLFEKIGGY